jgi:3-hydroxyacyl-[acyl-carrier-protein] dehydratase
MPPQFLYDISAIDLDKVLYDKSVIREMIPHRGAIEQLDAIVFADEPAGRIIGFKDVRADEFWVDGHIPGRPLMPGVLMLEAAAQLASFYLRHEMKWTGFVGFGGVDDAKFRQAVPPGVRLHIILQRIWIRHGRFCCKVQGLVKGALVFDAQITGVQMGQ